MKIVYIVCFCLIYLSIFGAERIKADTFKLLYFVKITSEHQSEISVSEIYIDLNTKMVKRQDQTNFPRFQTQERRAWKLIAYVFNSSKYM